MGGILRVLGCVDVVCLLLLVWEMCSFFVVGCFCIG